MNDSFPRFCFGATYLLEHKSIEDAVLHTLDLGLDFLELNTNFPQCLLGKMDVDYLKKVRKETSLGFSLHLDDAINVADFNPHVRHAYVKTVLEAIDFCIAANIPIINIHLAKGNIVTIPSGKQYLFAYHRELFLSALVEFRDLVTAAVGKSAVKVCIENTEGWESYEREGIDCLLQSQAFGLTFDIGHDHAVKDQDLDFFYTHQDRLHHMHAHDGYGQINHQALGTGDIKLFDRLNFAKAQDATVVLETKTIEAMSESVNWLKSNQYLAP